MGKVSLQWTGGEVLDVTEARKQLGKCLELLDDVEERLTSKELSFYQDMRVDLEDEDNEQWKPSYPQLNYAKDLVERYCY